MQMLSINFAMVTKSRAVSPSSLEGVPETREKPRRRDEEGGPHTHPQLGKREWDHMERSSTEKRRKLEGKEIFVVNHAN